MFLLVINLFELVAAVSGSIYIHKYREDLLSRYFVYFLWFTAFFDITFGWLPTFIRDFDQLTFLENTFLYYNQWAYNTYDVISFSFYLFYFSNFLESSRLKKLSRIFIIIYVVTSLAYLVFSGVYFSSPSLYGLLIGTIFLLFLIIGYYFQVLKSDKILVFHKNLVFYFSIGALVFHVLVNPIFIYGQYYEKKSPEFIEIYRLILTAANIFMYTCYTIGFIICWRKNKSYSLSTLQ